MARKQISIPRILNRERAEFVHRRFSAIMISMEAKQPHWDHDALARYVPASAKTVLDCTPAPSFAAAARSAGRKLYGADFSGREGAFSCEGYDDMVAVNPDEPLLPFADGQVDCVIGGDVPATLRDPGPLVQALARVLAPGGLAVFIFPNLQYHRHVVALARGQWRSGTPPALVRRYLRYFTAYEIHMLLARAGFPNPLCEVFAGDHPEETPLDEHGCIVHGRVTLGPLTPGEQAAFLARQYLVLAAKSPDG